MPGSVLLYLSSSFITRCIPTTGRVYIDADYGMCGHLYGWSMSSYKTGKIGSVSPSRMPVSQRNTVVITAAKGFSISEGTVDDVIKVSLAGHVAKVKHVTSQVITVECEAVDEAVSGDVVVISRTYGTMHASSFEYYVDTRLSWVWVLSAVLVMGAVGAGGVFIMMSKSKKISKQGLLSIDEETEAGHGHEGLTGANYQSIGKNSGHAAP